MVVMIVIDLEGDVMFKIGEFSKLTQVSVRMLRYYDEIGLLKPLHIDEESGYRMYGSQQIPELNKIIYLRDSGFQTSEIQMALQDDDNMMKLLEQKHSEVVTSIQGEREKLKKIELAQRELHLQANDLHYQILIKEVPSYSVLSFRKRIKNYYAEGEMWKELVAFAKQIDIDISETCFSLYHDEEYMEENVDVELCVPVQKKGNDYGCFRFYDTLAVAHMASMMVYGGFYNIGKAYRSFAQWIQQHSEYKMASPSRQIVHRGPWNEEDENQYLIELQIPLKK